MEGKIPMSARRHVTNKLRTAYQRASKKDRGRILDEMMATTGMGRSTARRMLTGPRMTDPVEQVDQRKLRPKSYGDDARSLLEYVWALMGFPCGKYFVVMLPIWLPLLDEAGDLAKPFATPASVRELEAMSPATIDRYLAPASRAMALKGVFCQVGVLILVTYFFRVCSWGRVGGLLVGLLFTVVEHEGFVDASAGTG
jgi:hypothetical protein